MGKNQGETDAGITLLDNYPHWFGLYGNQTLVIGNFWHNWIKAVQVQLEELSLWYGPLVRSAEAHWQRQSSSYTVSNRWLSNSVRWAIGENGGDPDRIRTGDLCLYRAVC